MPLPVSLEEFVLGWDTFRAGLATEAGEITATLGLEPHACDGAMVATRMPLAGRLCGPCGHFSSTALFGAADLTGSYLAGQAMGPGRSPLVTQSSMSFLDSSGLGPAVATARLQRAGGSVVVARVDVTDGDGRLLTASTFTYVPAPAEG
ncbi:PaaI family thioesterase [Sinomonas flava]|uniref:PaaI family thioesterase n=1 Tax=Sinomonas flava TaxID=496857 RepID=UPI0039A4F31D